ncbi:MAG: hypothetical protein R6X20_01090 [Phycisphaerae bacterium]
MRHKPQVYPPEAGRRLQAASRTTIPVAFAVVVAFIIDHSSFPVHHCCYAVAFASAFVVAAVVAVPLIIDYWVFLVGYCCFAFTTEVTREHRPHIHRHRVA